MGPLQSPASIFDASCNWIFSPKCVRRNTAWKCLGQQGQNIVAHCHVWVDCEQRILLRSLREGQRHTVCHVRNVGGGPGVWGRVIRGNNRVMIRDLHTLRHTEIHHTANTALCTAFRRRYDRRFLKAKSILFKKSFYIVLY